MEYTLGVSKLLNQKVFLISQLMVNITGSYTPPTIEIIFCSCGGVSCFGEEIYFDYHILGKHWEKKVSFLGYHNSYKCVFNGGGKKIYQKNKGMEFIVGEFW